MDLMIHQWSVGDEDDGLDDGDDEPNDGGEFPDDGDEGPDGNGAGDEGSLAEGSGNGPMDEPSTSDPAPAPGPVESSEPVTLVVSLEPPEDSEMADSSLVAELRKAMAEPELPEATEETATPSATAVKPDVPPAALQEAEALIVDEPAPTSCVAEVPVQATKGFAPELEGVARKERMMRLQALR